MKRFAVALIALTAACAASSVMAQASMAEQLRILRERRAGNTGEATEAAAPAQAPVPDPAETADVSEPSQPQQAETSKGGESLARSKNCLACHAISGKLVGPSYKEIAAKYPADDVDRLAASILNGSEGHWGNVPMRPNQWVDAEEARKLAAWILGMK